MFKRFIIKFFKKELSEFIKAHLANQPNWRCIKQESGTAYLNGENQYKVLQDFLKTDDMLLYEIKNNGMHYVITIRGAPTNDKTLIWDVYPMTQKWKRRAMSTINEGILNFKDDVRSELSKVKDIYNL